ncbi:unnamed protein product [Blepharisma stoltei]|uniref:SAM domain-containing protein n=1 Tax=Blepharisma stoltei TaxID=1481888 RepID=A0AAU9IZZ8_9CILI|nr:unnamed protein product [Blepharisma stoltei]
MEHTAVFRILANANLVKQYLKLFQQNGVDDETITELNENHLEEMGIFNKAHRDLILQCRDNLSNEEFPINTQLEEEKKETHGPQNPITIAMLLKSSNVSTRSKALSNDNFLRKLIMAELSDKNIDSIQCLDNCPRLQVLYLNSNKINAIENIEMLSSLRILSLENNLISRLSGLSNLSHLEKLHLDRNCIQKIEGLENLNELTELHCNRQNIRVPLEFDENSIVGISPNLRILSLCGNKIEDISLLWYLDKAEEIDLSENQIQMGEDFIKALSCMNYLKILNLSGNPIVRRPKYRDEVILSNYSIQELDGKTILGNEREYLLRLHGKGRAPVKKETKKGIDLAVVGNRFNKNK